MYIKPQNKILSNLELENVVNNTDDDGRTDDEQKKVIIKLDKRPKFDGTTAITTTKPNKKNMEK